MVVQFGEGWVTPSTMDTPLLPHAHHHFHHQVAVVPGALWVSLLEEPILITANLSHRISRLPFKGHDPVTISGKSSDLALTEAMKAKYKLEKKKRGYTIASIKDKGVHVATQLLVGKLMRKCHTDEVPASVIALAE